MEVLTITMPWPGKELHAHNKGHWRAKQKAVKDYRRLAFVTAMEEVQSGMVWNQAVVHYSFYMPDKRRRDTLNMAHAMKPAVDGVVDTGLIPDDNWQTLMIGTFLVQVDRENPRVELRFEEL